jgi:hypothetical protein
MIAPIPVNHHYVKSQPSDSRPYSESRIAIMQQDSLTTAGRRYTVQALAVRQQVNLRSAGRTHVGPLTLDNKSA